MGIFTNGIHRTNQGIIKQEEMADLIDNIKSAMVDNVIEFVYRKKNVKKVKNGQVVWVPGDLRHAWGTENRDIVSKQTFGGTCPPKRAGYIVYFDIESEDYRAFDQGRIKRILKITPASKFNYETENLKWKRVENEVLAEIEKEDKDSETVK